jgi:hypothetical protein
MAGGTRDEGSEPPFEGGSQRVPQHPEEVPTAGRSVVQTVVIVVAVLAALAAILWLVVPFTG